MEAHQRLLTTDAADDDGQAPASHRYANTEYTSTNCANYEFGLVGGRSSRTVLILIDTHIFIFILFIGNHGGQLYLAGML